MWTEFAPRQIAEKMAELGTPVSPHVVRVWLEEEGLALHKIAKVLAGGLSPDRDAQFQRIALLKAEYLDAGNPVFSLDTKVKERLGQRYRKGRVWTQHAFRGVRPRLSELGQRGDPSWDLRPRAQLRTTPTWVSVTTPASSPATVYAGTGNASAKALPS